MKYKELFGNSIKDDIDEIKKEIDEDQSIVFVYSGAGTLYDYIDALDYYKKHEKCNVDKNGIVMTLLKMTYIKKSLRRNLLRLCFYSPILALMYFSR